MLDLDVFNHDSENPRQDQLFSSAKEEKNISS